MPVITVGSSKGGCGKTTTALALASEIRSAKQDVCIIDADDQLSAFNWYTKRNKQDEITVINAAKLDRDIQIRKYISDAAKDYTFVIVDVAGIRSQRMQWSAASSDVWIIPQKATSLDAAATANLLDEDMEAVLGMRGGRPIVHRVLFTQTNSAVASKNVHHVIASTKQRVPVFENHLHQLDAFAAMDLYGMTLSEIEEADVAKATNARKHAKGILRQVIADIAEAERQAA